MRNNGFTLIELMIAIAILAIISVIAIPAYKGYIRETRLGVARVNADSIRIFLEDYQLDNGTYNAGGLTSFNTTALNTNFHWTPDGDGGNYAYLVTTSSNSYDILVTDNATSDWVRCEQRMKKCCDGKATDSSTSCPP